MNPLIELITAWDAYQAGNEGATVNDFCRYYLNREGKQELSKGNMSPDPDTTMARLIGRLGVMVEAYSKMALQAEGDIELEWFYFMNTLYHQQESNKTDVIQYNLYEPSTGIDILNRIIKAGYIKERNDPDDKRARLVVLTSKGEKKVMKCREVLHKGAYLMFGGMDANDKQLIIQLLASTEIKHTGIFAGHKGESIDTLLELVYGENAIEKMNTIQKGLKGKFLSKRGKSV